MWKQVNPGSKTSFSKRKVPLLIPNDVIGGLTWVVNQATALFSTKKKCNIITLKYKKIIKMEYLLGGTANHIMNLTRYICFLEIFKGYLKKGLSMDAVLSTNSIEPPISQVMSEMPTRGLPFFASSWNRLVLSNLGYFFSQYMQLTEQRSNQLVLPLKLQID